ncbi:MAG: DUF2235 domain-containing protein [Alphaproteobacteria bacterium]
MKRLIFCCDGTWNRLAADYPTNVLKLAGSILPHDDDGIVQNVFYIEGVGTGRGTSWVAKAIDKVGGGMFGFGLLKNIEEAYRLLAFNYEPGDQIYIFGFSRGAYTARSLAGLIRASGIISREQIKRLPEAIDRYRKRGQDGHPDTPDNCAFRFACSPAVITSDAEHTWRMDAGLIPEGGEPLRLKLAYVGVWDTVGALGVPNFLLISRWTNRRLKFHDTALSSSVSAARHAVALDERRSSFAAATWKNLDGLNAKNPGEDGRPHYQQLWFPGVHGSVGGGGDIVSLSNDTLLWVLQGAVRQGLAIDADFMQAAREGVDFRGPIMNSSTVDRGIANMVLSLIKRNRTGPHRLEEVAAAARKRWAASAGELPNGKLYRPASLRRISQALDGA